MPDKPTTEMPYKNIPDDNTTGEIKELWVKIDDDIDCVTDLADPQAWADVLREHLGELRTAITAPEGRCVMTDKTITELLDNLLTHNQSQPVWDDYHFALRQAITALKQERDEYAEETIQLEKRIRERTVVVDPNTALQARSDLFPELAEALGELVGHIPVWMNAPYDTRGDWIRATLAKARKLSPASGQGDSADTTPDTKLKKFKAKVKRVGKLPCNITPDEEAPNDD